MTPRGRFNRHRSPRVAIVIAVAFAGPFFVASTVGVRVNVTPSLPLGIYRITSDVQAGFAEFCPEEPYAKFAIERGYRSAGSCPDGAAPFMKPIVAVPGDVVSVTAHGIAVDGNLIENTRPQANDRKGRPLESWPFGEYQVRKGSVWVASSYSPWSYDSRYFGPISVGLLRSRLRPVWTP
jgi:conjugative transfer signal peptidase TraF